MYFDHTLIKDVFELLSLVRIFMDVTCEALPSEGKLYTKN